MSTEQHQTMADTRSNELLSIGEIVDRTGLAASAIWFYEEQELVHGGVGGASPEDRDVGVVVADRDEMEREEGGDGSPCQGMGEG